MKMTCTHEANKSVVIAERVWNMFGWDPRTLTLRGVSRPRIEETVQDLFEHWEKEEAAVAATQHG